MLQRTAPVTSETEREMGYLPHYSFHVHAVPISRLVKGNLFGPASTSIDWPDNGERALVVSQCFGHPKFSYTKANEVYQLQFSCVIVESSPSPSAPYVRRWIGTQRDNRL